MTDQDTAELVQRAAAGDELAWRQLTDRLGPLLCRVSSTYRLGEAEAADAVATVWLKLVENIDSLRDGNAVTGWLITTLRRECLARAARAVVSGPWQTSPVSTSRSTSSTSTVGC